MVVMSEIQVSSQAACVSMAGTLLAHPHSLHVKAALAIAVCVYSIHLLVFLMEAHCVLCEAQTESLYAVQGTLVFTVG